MSDPYAIDNNVLYQLACAAAGATPQETGQQSVQNFLQTMYEAQRRQFDNNRLTGNIFLPDEGPQPGTKQPSSKSSGQKYNYPPYVREMVKNIVSTPFDAPVEYRIRDQYDVGSSDQAPAVLANNELQIRLDTDVADLIQISVADEAVYSYLLSAHDQKLAEKVSKGK